MSRAMLPASTPKGAKIFLAAFLIVSPPASMAQETPYRPSEIIIAQRGKAAPDSSRIFREGLSAEEGGGFERGSRRWEDLPQEKRMELERRMERWQQLPPEEKDLIRKRHRQWKELPAGEQEKIREKLNRWEKLSPPEQEEIRRKFKGP